MNSVDYDLHKPMGSNESVLIRCSVYNLSLSSSLLYLFYDFVKIRELKILCVDDLACDKI